MIPEPIQCHSITKNGTQCKRTPFLGGRYCWQHDPVLTRIALATSIGSIVSFILILISLAADLKELGILNLYPFSVASISTQTSRFTPISMASIVDWSQDNFVTPPLGDIAFDGIDFQLTDRIFVSQLNLRGHFPTEVNIETHIPNPIALHMLINAGWLHDSIAAGQEVGKIILEFSDGRSLETPLRAYQTIREFWAFADEVKVNEMSLSNDAIQWKNVFREEHSREGRPAVAYIDMVSIFIPPPYAETSLRSIRIIDTSMDNLKSIDPGLIVTGITVETR